MKMKYFNWKKESPVQKAVWLLGCLLLMLGISGCGQSLEPAETAPDGKEKLKVVSTIFPSYDFVRQIGGEYVEVTQLLKPGMEAHSYEPSPRDIIRITESDLFLYAGGESDVWVEEILSGSDSQVRSCSLLDWVDPLEEESVEGMQETGHKHEHDHEESAADSNLHDHTEDAADNDVHAHTGVVHLHEDEYDEHVWTSPANAILLVENLRDTLCSLDPERSAIYQANAEQYLNELHQLDADYSEMIEHADRNLLVFGDRFPFLYLARNYGLDYYAAFPGCSAQTEPSAAMIAFLTDKVNAEEIPVIFQLELSNGKIADCIAEVTGAETAVLHSCHTLTKDEQERGETYLSLMRQNLEALRKALYS